MDLNLRTYLRRWLPGAVALLWFAWASPAAAEVVHLTAPQARDLIQSLQSGEEFVILDIRTPGEYAQGHLSGAVLLDYYGSRYVEKLRGLDKSKHYLIYCRSGNRSSRTLKLIEKMGFEKIYHLQRGIIDWVGSRYELVR